MNALLYIALIFLVGGVSQCLMAKETARINAAIFKGLGMPGDLVNLAGNESVIRVGSAMFSLVGICLAIAWWFGGVPS